MRKLRFIIVVFFIMSIVFFGLNSFAASLPNKVKVILIGLDGATWDVILPLVNQGKTPNFEKLIKEGIWGKLVTIKPTVSPVIWTSIITGKKPDKHGILDYYVRLPGSYDTVLITSNIRKTKALWNILSEHGKKVCIVGWQATWPAEEVAGFMVTDRFLYHPNYNNLTNLTYPKELYEEIRGLNLLRNKVSVEHMKSLNFPTLDTCREDNSPCFSTPLEDFRSAYQRDQTHANIGLYLLSKYESDFFSIYLSGIDKISHNYWKYMQPEYFEVSQGEIKKYKDAINNYYIYIDAILGDFLGHAGENTIVFIISDHGFQPTVPGHYADYRPPSFNRFLEMVNLLSYKHDMSDLSWKDLNKKENIVWENTEAYECGNAPWFWERKICLNLKGREPKGIIEPVEYEKAIEKAKQLLSNIMIKETQKPLLRFKPYADADCDFMVGLNVNQEDIENRHLTYLNKIYSLPIRELFLHSDTSGSHYNAPEGILAIWGEGIQRGKIEDANIFDIIPTILYLMDLPVAKDMDGKILTSAIIPGLVKKKPVEYIDTYDIEQSRVSEPLISPADEEIKDKLRSLGYIQ
ncbi:MAG: alkaline phosphatase family protein [Candidatus Omnitrophota bacterium]